MIYIDFDGVVAAYIDSSYAAPIAIVIWKEGSMLETADPHAVAIIQKWLSERNLSQGSDKGAIS